MIDSLTAPPRVKPIGGDLVIWSTPDRRTVLGIVLREELGHGNASTGWYRVLSNTSTGSAKTYLAHSTSLEVITSGVNV